MRSFKPHATPNPRPETPNSGFLSGPGLERNSSKGDPDPREEAAPLLSKRNRAVSPNLKTLRPCPRQLSFKCKIESVLTTSMSRGFTKFSVFLKRVSLLNPRVRANFVAFSFRKKQERASKFGSILGHNRVQYTTARQQPGGHRILRVSKWGGYFGNRSGCYL